MRLKLDQLQNSLYENYIATIGEKFCPFLIPSMENNCLFFSYYDLEETSLENLRQQIFYLGVFYTEILRLRRRREPDKKKQRLLCENIILRYDAEENGENVFGFPHWLLRNLYTKHDVLFGKFWIGEKHNTEQGTPIPSATENFLSIRSAIKKKDHRFFHTSPQLLDDYYADGNEKNNVFDELNIGVAREYDYYLAKFLDNPDDQKIYDKTISFLYDNDLYSKTSEWVEVINAQEQ